MPTKSAGIVKEPLKNISEAVSSRQKTAKKRSLYVINEHFEPIFNAEMTTQVVFQRFIREIQDQILADSLSTTHQKKTGSFGYVCIRSTSSESMITTRNTCVNNLADSFGIPRSLLTSNAALFLIRMVKSVPSALHCLAIWKAWENHHKKQQTMQVIHNIVHENCGKVCERLSTSRDTKRISTTLV